MDRVFGLTELAQVRAKCEGHIGRQPYQRDEAQHSRADITSKKKQK